MQQQGQLRVTQGGSLPLSRSPLQPCFVSCSENLWPQLQLPLCCESHWSLWPPHHRASFCFSFLSSWVPNLKICCNCSSPPLNLPSLLADHPPKPRGQGCHHPQTPLQWQQLPFPELLWPVMACTKAKLLSWPPPESAIPISSECSLGCQSSCLQCHQQSSLSRLSGHLVSANLLERTLRSTTLLSTLCPYVHGDIQPLHVA